MGDLLEFATNADADIIFYKITTGAIKFSVKTFSNGDAAVILSPTPSLRDSYSINFGHGNGFIYQHGNQTHQFTDPNLLLEEEYKEFWVAWNNGSLRLGLANNSTPIFINEFEGSNLHYIAFSGSSWDSRLKWKINLPPLIERPIEVKLRGGEPHWVKYEENKIPNEAIIGGFENEILYVIRGYYPHTLTPGKFVPSKGVGYLGWGWQMHEKTEFEVLCGYNYEWISAESDKIPFGAIVAGYSADATYENLYVGRSKHGSHLVPGKVQTTHYTCYIPCNGREIRKRWCEVIVVPCSSDFDHQEYYIKNCENVDSAISYYNINSDNYNDSESE